MPSILITGANRGLGLEFARQYSKDGCRVFATARSEAPALSKLQKTYDNLSVHPLDVTDHDSVRALARELEREPIDILLNNAGVMGPERQSFGQIDYEGFLETLKVNTLGPLRVAEAFVEHVAKSERRLMVAITSGMGSIQDSSGGDYAYRASKAALNMTFHNIGVDLKARGIIAIVINPGWVQTDMGGRSAPTSPEESIRKMRAVFDKLTLADTGSFQNYRGGQYAW